MKKVLFLLLLSLIQSSGMFAQDVTYTLSLKQPGEKAVFYKLQQQGNRLVSADGKQLPVVITLNVNNDQKEKTVTVSLKASQNIYYRINASLKTGFPTDDCDFYLPGFWYHKNLRSPKEAPSFKVAKSWNVREDRLSSPLSSVFNDKQKTGWSVMRCLDAPQECLTSLKEGEVILSGQTSIGYLGFDNADATASLTFGYPYVETPKRYISKLTLTPAIYTFARLGKGETKQVSWKIKQYGADDFGAFVSAAWSYCYSQLQPKPLANEVNTDSIKKVLTNYFRQAYVDKYDVKFLSGTMLRTADCLPSTEMQIGFCGRTLLNAFNEIEYGEAHNDAQLVKMGHDILGSFLQHGFTAKGFFYDHLEFDKKNPWDDVHSIRQQSEAVYAIFHYLNYEKQHGRKHKDWEKRLKTLLDNLTTLQNADGSFPRKFHDDGSTADVSGGSTPSATVPLVMGYVYFGEKRYLNAARRTVDYLENNIINKSDYFSSTLDANCEDKEAAISAITACYYMTFVSSGKLYQHYVDLCKKAAYFALSWYYLWDVPFAQGQMLGDLGLKSHGWGNVSVENNHIDVFAFEFPHILNWLGEQIGDQRFCSFYKVIWHALPQLLPTSTRHCGIAKPGFYPEVVQHTTWDYGKNGKGFYNIYFAPGWTVASLWELYSPYRTVNYFKGKKYAKIKD